MSRKSNSKALARAHEKFQRKVTEYILSHGASHDGQFYDYQINTPAGPLLISVWDNAIMTRFEDVKKGKEFTALCGCPCNPYSGKWNFHFGNDPASLDPDVVLGHFGFYFEKLLAWTPGVEC